MQEKGLAWDCTGGHGSGCDSEGWVVSMEQLLQAHPSRLVSETLAQHLSSGQEGCGKAFRKPLAALGRLCCFPEAVRNVIANKEAGMGVCEMGEGQARPHQKPGSLGAGIWC